jgi:hypothetical protein
MKLRQILFAATALALMMAFSTEKSVATGTTPALPVAASRSLTIHGLQRTGKVPEIAIASIRDPFFGPDPVPATTGEPSPGKSVNSAPATPAFPGFRIIGKQQDDDGWSVFIGEPGKQGQVWVVREGESFNEHFHVSKLSPPALIIKDTRSRKSKNFDIGKDEE